MSHEEPWGETREWFTPPELFTALGIRFDLDPASPMSGPVPWVPADRFYSPRENGLVMPWSGRVWLNPPYGPPGVSFIDRLIAHEDGMLLIPARTETRVFQRAAEAAHEVVFLRERLHFIREDGFRGRAGFASALFAFGGECMWALRQARLGVGGSLYIEDDIEALKLA